MNYSINAEVFEAEDWLVSAILSQSMQQATSGKAQHVNKTRQTKTKRKITKMQAKKLYLMVILMIAGDIHANPGPNWRYPCRMCLKPAKVKQRAIQCEQCNKWSHVKCIDMTIYEYENFAANESLTWLCQDCLFPYSDSYMESLQETRGSELSFVSDEELSTSPPPVNSSVQEDRTEEDLEISFPELPNLRRKCNRNVIIAHVNINSSRYKYTALNEVQHDGLIDCLTVQETKLDASFPDTRFHVPGCRTYRADRDAIWWRYHHVRQKRHTITQKNRSRDGPRSRRSHD